MAAAGYISASCVCMTRTILDPALWHVFEASGAALVLFYASSREMLTDVVGRSIAANCRAGGSRAAWLCYGILTERKDDIAQ